MEYPVSVGDQIQSRKPHACGNDIWDVYRIGADIGIRCTQCARHVMLTRRDYYKAVKKVVKHAEPKTVFLPTSIPDTEQPE